MKTEGTILLVDEEDQGGMNGRGGMNESHGEMLIKEGMKGLKLGRGKGVGGAKGRRSSFIELYLQITVCLQCGTSMSALLLLKTLATLW